MERDACVAGIPPDLSERVEAVVREETLNLERMSPEEVRDLVHGLRVSRAELQLQNEALRQSCEEQACLADDARNLLETAPDVIIRFDRNFIIRYVNPAFTRLTGSSKERAVGHSIAEMDLPDGNADLWKNRIHRVFETGEDISLEFEYAGVQGRKFFHARIVPEQYDGEDRKQAIFLAREITELAEAREELRENSERFRTIAELISNYAYSYRVEPDSRLTVEWVIGAFEEITGYTPEEANSQGDFVAIVHADDQEENLRRLRTLLSGHEVRTRLRYVARDGTVHWMQDNARPILDEQGRVVRIIGATVEISDLKRAEEALLKSQEELQEQVWRRTVAIENLRRESDERKKSEEEIRRSQRLLSAMYENLPIGVFVLDRTGEILLINPAAKRIWAGEKYVGLAGFGAYKGWLVDSGEPISAGEWAAARVIRNGKAILGEEVEIEAFDGSRKIIRNSAIPLHDEQGEITVVVTLNEDITSRKLSEMELREYREHLEELVAERTEELTRQITERGKAEKALHKSEEKYRRIVETAQEGIIIFDADLRISFANSRAAEMFGYSEEDLQRKTPTDFVLPEDMEKQKIFLKHRRVGMRERYEFRYIRKDGNHLWAIVSASPVMSDDGRFLGSVVMLTDITQRKHTEELLQKYELLSAYSRDIILYLRSDSGRILEANDSAVNAYGYSREELLKMTVHELRAPDTREGTRAQMAEARGHGILFETRHRRRDGSTFPVEVSSAGAVIGETHTLISVIRDITERKKAEEYVRRGREMLETVLNAVPVGIVFSDATGVITYFNPATNRIFGGPVSGSAIGPSKGTYALLTPDGGVFPEDELPLVRSIRNGERVTNVELVIRRKDGSQVTVLSDSVPTHDTEGRVTGAVVSLQDITDRKRAQKALLESEERYRTLFTNMSEGFAVGEPVLDETNTLRDIRFLEINDAFIRQTGLSRDIIGHPLTEVLPNLERYWIDNYGSVAQTGQPIRFTEYNRDTGRHYDVYCYQPNAGRFAITFRDVTRQREAELALRESEERFRLALENSATSVFSQDRELRYTWIFNPLMGGNPEEYVGRRESEFLSPEDAEFYTIIKNRVMETGQEVRGEHAVQKDGERRNFSYVIKPQRNERGEIIGIIAAATDVTLIRRAEEQAREYAERLRRQTAQLAATNQELESFSYSISHDLRAPLRSLDGFSLALMEDYADRLDEEGRDYLGRIRAAAQRMSRLIEDLLHLSRTTRSELHYTTVDLSALARSVTDELQTTHPGRQVEVSISDGISVQGDETLLRQVLQNLIGNAWKFTSHREDARIEFGERWEDGRRVFHVRDNGAGFDMNHADNLFIPFRRLHSEKEFSGTGIGLSIVKRIIDRHGGAIWAESEPGKGASFNFTLEE